MNVVFTLLIAIGAQAQVFHEALDDTRLPFMHLVSPCSTGVSHITTVCQVNNQTVVVGGLGRIGWVNDSATDVAWECSPTQEMFVDAAVRNDTLLVGGEFGHVWIRTKTAQWYSIDQQFGSEILDVDCTDLGWFILNNTGEIYFTSSLEDRWQPIPITVASEVYQPVKFDVWHRTIGVCLTNRRWAVSTDFGETWRLSVDTLSQWNDWKSILATSDGRWFLGSEGAQVWQLDSTYLRAKVTYTLFPVWPGIAMQPKPDAIVSITEIDTIGIVANVSGYRQRLFQKNYTGIYLLVNGDTSWNFRGFSETMQNQVSIPSDPGIGVFVSGIGEICGATSGNVNGTFISSIQRPASADNSYFISWAHCSQGSIGRPLGTLNPGWVTPVYRDVLPIDDRSVLVTYIQSNSDNGTQTSYEDSCRVRRVTVTTDSVIVEDRPALPPMITTVRSGGVMFGKTLKGGFIKSTDGANFEPVTNIPFGLRYVSSIQSNGQTIMVHTSTTSDPDSTFWDLGRIFVSTNGGHSWTTCALSLPQATAIRILAVALGSNNRSACFASYTESDGSNEQNLVVIIWDENGLATVLPQLPEQFSFGSLQGSAVITFHNNNPVLWTNLTSGNTSTPQLMFAELVDGNWVAGKSIFYYNLDDKISNSDASLRSVRYLDDVIFLKSQWNSWLSTDEGLSFIRIQDPFQNHCNVNDVVQLGDRYLCIGENNILATALAPLPTSIRSDRSNSHAYVHRQPHAPLGTWMCGTPLRHSDAASTVSIFSVTGKLIARYSLLSTPNPVLQCTDAEGAFIAIICNEMGATIDTRRIVR